MLSYELSGRLVGTVSGPGGSKARKIEPRDVEALRAQWAEDPAGLERQVERLQLAVYVLLRGGGLARFACTQPQEFYIDQRCSVKDKRSIYNAVAVLCLYAAAAGYNLTGFDKDGEKKLKEPSIPLAGWILEP